ncbi:crosslink repair DNA glycosylase YcaQ family protein [Georgenia halophila]|uniref:Crosslink repair DNA glycosylase YcaQ family protein n=1 Tax=Georgenia halophila TaxID=620889 RepID=A0ABP8LI76_9MICO
MTTKDIGLLRLVAQRVVGPGLPGAVDVVRHMTAMQAQAFAASVEAVAVRSTDRDPHEVVAALNRGEIVRSWPMRGTLHLTPAEDLSWMLTVTADRMLAAAARRRAELGIDDAMIERARALAVDALAGGRSLSRDELMGVWYYAGMLEVKQRGYHLLWHLAQHGHLVLGPVEDRKQRIVLLDEWVPRPRLLDREQALGEWALRYFRSHGPATLKDFAWWTKVTMADARTGLAIARPELATLDVDGAEHLMDPAAPALLGDLGRKARATVLLPAFDEMILGYQDRTATLPAEHAGRVVPGANGVFKPVVVSGGRAVGTWRRVGRGRVGEKGRPVDVEPFTSLTTTTQRTVPRVADSYPVAPVAG